MRIICFVVVCCFAIHAASGQNAIPNPGFEDWEEGGSIFNGYEEPVGWGTPNPTSASFGFQTATRVTSPELVHSGNAALRLKTHHVNVLNLYAQGAAVTGNVNIEVVPFSVQVTGGVSFVLRPDTLAGWYMYFPQGSDTAQVGMLLSRWNNETGQRDTVGTALLPITEPEGTYSRFAIPFEYMLDVQPDTMMIGAICSSFFEPEEGSMMYIDDLELIYAPTAVFETISAEIKAFPNPARDQVRFAGSDLAAVQICDLTGKIISRKSLTPDGSVSIDELAPGVYLFQVFDQAGKQIGFSRVMVY